MTRSLDDLKGRLREALRGMAHMPLSAALNARSGQDIDRLLAEHGDSHIGMSCRLFLRMMDEEGFETLFALSVEAHNCFGFGRRRDGLVVNAVFRDDGLTSASLECSKLHVYSISQEMAVVLVEADGLSAAARIRMPVHSGLLIRLSELGQTQPFWWNVLSDGTVSDALDNALIGLDMSGTRGWKTPRELLAIRSAENTRRFSLVPDAWRDIMDFPRKRTLAQAIEMSPRTEAGT